MLQGLAKAKALKEFKALRQDKASLKGLALAKGLKRLRELRSDLGMGKKQDEQKVYVDTLVFNLNQQVLLVQRHANDDFMPNKWWIAGGKLEQGESLEQGAKRELLEETGIKLSDVSFVEKVKLQNGDISHRFTGVVDNDTPIHLQKDELQAYRWVNIDELSKFDLLGKLSDLQDLVELASEIVGFDGDVERDDDKSALNNDENQYIYAKDGQSRVIGSHHDKNGNGSWVVSLKNNVDGVEMWGTLRTTFTTQSLLKKFPQFEEVLNDGWDGNDQAVKADLSVLEVSDDPVEVVRHVYKNAQQQYAGKQPKAITVKSDGSVILLGWQGIKHALSKDSNKTIALATTCIEKLIENAVFLQELKNKPKGNKKVDENNKVYTKSTLLYKSALQEQNGIIDIGIIVKVLEDGSRMYDYFSLNIKKAPNGISGETNQPAVIRSDENIISRTENNVNSQEGWDGKTADIPQTAYQLHDKPTTTKRQKDNDTAVALMRELQETGRKATSEEKAILSRYTGTGGNLVGEDGLQGSDYEYYTPIEVAGSMWDLLKQSGFKGGMVLDPSAGTGIFKASAPKDDNILMHSVELSEISGKINALINDDDRHSVTISPFEQVASSTEDETMDAIMTNVPFGDTSARGANRFLDSKFQDDTLEEYFIKRSLDKLKPNGLAMFIVPTKMLDGKNYAKFRQAVLLRADLLGAYRLPNKVFNATGADVTTDIIVLKKFSQDVKDKIDNLFENGGLKTLQQAKVLDKDIITGQYFSVYGRAFVLGEYQTGKGRFGDVVRVVNDDSLANILKLVQKFPDSRIDYSLLEMTDFATEINFKNGDVRVLDGTTFEYHDGVWQKSTQQQVFDETPFVNFLSLIEHGVKKSNIDEYQGYLASVGRKMPEWLYALHNGTKNDDELYYWAVLNAVFEALKVEKDDGYEPHYPTLTKAMNNIFSDYQANRIKSKNPSYKGLHKAVSIAFNVVGVSDYWKTGQGVQFDSAVLNHQQAYENAVYNGKAENFAVDVDLIKQSNPDFNPLTDDDFCINADGSKVTLARDYYSGNYGEFLAKIDAEIEQATEPKIKEKLLKQKAHAESLIDYTDVKKLQFSLLSTIVPFDMKFRYFNEFVDSQVIVSSKGEKDKLDFDNAVKVTNKDLTESMINGDYNNHTDLRRYLLNRIFISIGGQVLKIDDKGLEPEVVEILNVKLQRYFAELNLSFEAWLKAQKDYMAELDYQFNAPSNKEFPTIADGTPFEIANFKPKYENFKSLHDYQFEEVRRLSRSFGGICGFDVGLGKAQPLTAKILTPNGWKLMGDIQVGDEVMAQDGTITRVTGVFPQGEKEIFAVKFSDGAMTHCCDEHLWLTQTEKDRKNERYSRLKGIDRVETGTVKTLSDIRQTLIYQKQKNHKIPMVEPIQFAHKAFTINPYLLGVLLGDGNLTGRRVAFCTPDNDVIERVSTIIQRDFENAIYIRVQESENRAIQHYFSRVDKNAPNPIRDELKQLGLCEKYSHEKFIPVEYLCSSIEQRIDLLHGLMDTDGYVSKDGITIQYYSTSEQMANDMIALVQSLGGIAWKKPKQGKYKKDNGEVVECKICYIVSIRMPSHINPFYLSRKKDRVKPKSKYIPVRYITEVTSVGVAQAQCISIEHSSHLYITDDYIVTHNTATALATIQNLHNIGVKQRTMTVVPNHTISKWAKDIRNVYDDVSDVLVVGTKQNQNDNADSKFYAEDLALLTTEQGKQYRKILLTVEAMGNIPMREQYIVDYFGDDSQGAEEWAEMISNRRSDKERKDGAIASIINKLNKYESKLPYFEDMGVDSIVFDEAQVFKNGMQSGEDFNRIGGLAGKALKDLAQRALSARLKSWFVRGSNKQNHGTDDGVVLLTATPFTNSPIEIMTMLSLAIGDEKLKKIMGGTAVRNANDFLSLFAQIESVTQKDILGRLVNKDMFTGFTNVDLLKKVVHQVANIQNAKDRGLKIPNEHHETSRVQLPDSDMQQLEKMKLYYRIAKVISKGDKASESDKVFVKTLPQEIIQEYELYKEQLKEEDSTIGHAFSLINRMSEVALLGSEMALERNFKLSFDETQSELAEKIAKEFNTAKRPSPIFTTTRNYPLPDKYVTEKIKENEETGEIKVEYTVKAEVVVYADNLVLNVDDATMISNLMTLVEKYGLNVRPKLSAKVQALMENVKLELSQPKHQGFAKQLIFCDTLSMHHVIKRALISECGIPSSQIAILNAQTLPDGKAGNPDTEDVQAIQDLFADNHYTIVIANKKAETGIDLQKGTQAIHHLTTGWTPDSLQQRNGRGVRQGNTQDVVTIYAYNAEGTFDEYKKTLIDNKADWIEQVMDKGMEIGKSITVSQALSEQDYEDLINADSSEKIAELVKAKAEREAQAKAERVQAKNTFIFNEMSKARENARRVEFSQVLNVNMTQTLNAIIDLLASKAGGQEQVEKRHKKAWALFDKNFAGLPSDVKKIMVYELEERAMLRGSNSRKQTISFGEDIISLYSLYINELAVEKGLIPEHQKGKWYGSLMTEEQQVIKTLHDELLQSLFGENADTPLHKKVRSIVSSRIELEQTTKEAFLNNDDSEFDRDERQAIVENRATVRDGELIYDLDIFKFTIKDSIYYALAKVYSDGGLGFVTAHNIRGGDGYKYEKTAKHERQDAINYMIEEDFTRAKELGMKMSDSLPFSALLPEVYNAVQEKVNTGKEAYDNEYVRQNPYYMIHKESGRAVGDLAEVWRLFVNDELLSKAKETYYAPMSDLIVINELEPKYVEIKRKDLEQFSMTFTSNMTFYKEHLKPFLLANGFKLNAEYEMDLSYLESYNFKYSSVEQFLGVERQKFTPIAEYDEYVKKLAEHKFGDVIANLDELLEDGLDNVFGVSELSNIKSTLGERSDKDPIIEKRDNMIGLAKLFARKNPKGIEMVALKDRGKVLYQNKEKLKKIAQHYLWNREQSAWYVDLESLFALMDTSWFDWDSFSVHIPEKYA